MFFLFHFNRMVWALFIRTGLKCSSLPIKIPIKCVAPKTKPQILHSAILSKLKIAFKHEKIILVALIFRSITQVKVITFYNQHLVNRNC